MDSRSLCLCSVCIYIKKRVEHVLRPIWFWVIPNLFQTAFSYKYITYALFARFKAVSQKKNYCKLLVPKNIGLHSALSSLNQRQVLIGQFYYQFLSNDSDIVINYAVQLEVLFHPYIHIYANTLHAH